MSLFALPVTIADLTALQQGLTFKTNPTEAAAEVTAINAGNDTVFAYAQRLLDANISFSQVAMAMPSLMFNATPTTATLANITNVFLPAQVSLAVALHLDPTVYAAEATGLALSNGAAFAANFGSLSVTDFAIKVGGLTGVNTGAIVGFLQFWEGFYAKFPQAIPPGSTVDLAAKGAALGDAVGNALVAHLPFQDTVENALIDIATGQYVVGVPINTLPQHIPLQGDPNGNLQLTINVDHLTAQFTGAVFNAGPQTGPAGGPDNTLNVGDVLLDTKGDGTINYTAVDSAFFTNDPFAQGVTMTGIAVANILNLSEPGDLAGFAGDITGLRVLTIQAGSTPDGDVQVGQNGQGLNTALTTVNINAGDGGDVNVWIKSAAFTGGEVLQVNLNGVTTFADFNVTNGANFYGEIDVNSAVSANEIDLDTNAATVATVVATGDQELTLHGSVLDVGNLDLFDGSAATGDLIIGDFFGIGDVQALGGSGDDTFSFFTDGAVDVQGNAGDDTFIFYTNFPGDGPDTSSFTAADKADGGSGNNELQIEAYHGALLGAGVGPNITNIQIIEHIAFDSLVGDLSVDMARSGSATTLELAAPEYAFFNVDVTNLTNADTVVYEGNYIDNLTLENVSPIGIFNLVLDADSGVFEDNFGNDFGNFQYIGDLIVANAVPATGILNLTSTGAADTNVIDDANRIDVSMHITGDVDLFLGIASPYGFTSDAYNTEDGVIDATQFTGNLYVALDGFDEQVFAGLGNDYIQLQNAPAGFAYIVDLSTGGSDTVEFQESFAGNDIPTTNPNYTLVTGFSVADDTLNVDADGFDAEFTSTNGFNLANGDEITDLNTLVYTTNTAVDGNPFITLFGYSFVKVDTPVNVLAQTPQDGFEAAMGATGSISTGSIFFGDAEDVLFAYYDTTHQQMVLGYVDDASATGPGNQIDANDDFDVIALVSMSKADYDAFNGSNIAFNTFDNIFNV